jgi:hypothetical protein
MDGKPERGLLEGDDDERLPGRARGSDESRPGHSVIGAYVWNVQERGDAEHGRAMAIATLALASAALTARLSGLRTLTARVITALTIASTIIMIETPLLAGTLHLKPLHAVDWSIAIAGSLLVAALPRVFATPARAGG